MDAEAQGAALRAMVNADILQPCVRPQQRPAAQCLRAGLRARADSRARARSGCRASSMLPPSARPRRGSQRGHASCRHGSGAGAANKLAELFRQISLQLDQDRHALLELAEDAKSADASMPIAQRYRRVLEALRPLRRADEPDDGHRPTRHVLPLPGRRRALTDLAFEQLSVQGGLALIACSSDRWRTRPRSCGVSAA